MRILGLLAGALVMAGGLWGCSEPAEQNELVVYTSRNDHQQHMNRKPLQVTCIKHLCAASVPVTRTTSCPRR